MVRAVRDPLADSLVLAVLGGYKALEQVILFVAAGRGLDQQGRLGHTCCTRRPVRVLCHGQISIEEEQCTPEICCETSPGCLRRNVLQQGCGPWRRTGGVVVLLAFSKDGAQVPLAEDQAAIE